VAWGAQRTPLTLRCPAGRAWRSGPALQTKHLLPPGTRAATRARRRPGRPPMSTQGAAARGAGRSWSRASRGWGTAQRPGTQGRQSLRCHQAPLRSRRQPAAAAAPARSAPRCSGCWARCCGRCLRRRPLCSRRRRSRASARCAPVQRDLCRVVQWRTRLMSLTHRGQRRLRTGSHTEMCMAGGLQHSSPTMRQVSATA